MIYNISFDISGILILVVICLILQKMYVMNQKSNRMFRRFVVTALVSGILDVVTAYTISYSARIPIFINVILNTLYMYFANLSSFSGVQYIISTAKRHEKSHDIANGIILGVYVVLLTVNLFTGIIFDFENHTYNKGPLFYSTFGTTLFLVIHLAGFMVSHRESFSKRQLLIFSSFVFSPVIFVVIQMIFSSYLLTFFATALSALIMVFTLETPDFAELEYLRKNLEMEVQTRTLELQNMNKELEKKNKQAKQDMELAAHVQQVLYPHTLNYFGWDIAVKFEPLSGVSGDLYDFYVLEGILRGFGLFDVSGHGISSGLVTVLARTVIFHDFRTTLPLNLSEAMKRINNSVIRAKGDIENYLTGVVCRIDKEDPSKIEIANAGAPYPIYKSKNETDSVLIMPNKDKPQYGMIGVGGLDVCFQTIKIEMDLGDVLVLYTDGLTEAENYDGEQYGMWRIQNVINRTDGTAREIMDALTADFKNFIGDNEVEDDISAIVIKRIEEESAEENLVEELESID